MKKTSSTVYFQNSVSDEIGIEVKENNQAKFYSYFNSEIEGTPGQVYT